MRDNRDRHEINALSVLSRKVGIDPLQVQAAGGNTSVKLGNTMWIKASGTCLADACDTDLFVPVQIQALLDALEQGDPSAEKSVDFVVQSDNPSGLRPSIETTVHAVLPQRVVVHVHCVDTISVAIQINAQSLFATLLADYNWLWVPYARPGLPLSKYISSNMSPGVNVVVLGNHGLVVAADTVEAAEELLQQVRASVKQATTNTPAPDMDTLTQYADGTEYLPADDPATHEVALDESMLSVAAGGSLYPDHVIFIGDGSTVAKPGLAIADVARANRNEDGEVPRSIIVPGAGVLMHRCANAAQHALARCLSDVTARVSEGTSINYLDEKQVYDLLHWEAESYRQTLASD